MKSCPNCESLNQEEASICASCGFHLQNAIPEGKPAFSSGQIGGIPTEELDQSIVDLSEALGKSILAFKFEKSGSIMPMPSSGEYVLGRVSEGQTILPDLDLSTYDAFEAGVSRIHALIRISKEIVSITDLGSSNGTYINEKQISQQIQHKIENEDMIQLGRLRMQAIVHIPS